MSNDEQPSVNGSLARARAVSSVNRPYFRRSVRVAALGRKQTLVLHTNMPPPGEVTTEEQISSISI